MIDTKEEYERLQFEVQQLGYIALEDSGVEIIETIEALREVARGADEVRYAWSADIGDYGFSEKLDTALKALPNWIVED